MRTIFITISRGATARNLLQNKFFELIKKEFGKVVIITPAYNDKRFVSEFGGQGIIFYPMQEIGRSFFTDYYLKINNFLMYNLNTKRVILYNYIEDVRFLNHSVKYIKYIFVKIIFQPLSKLKFIRKFLRYADFLFFQKNLVLEYRNLIRVHNPNIIFSTSMMEDSDAALIKAARKEGVKSIAMPKTWDNLSKEYFRAKADKVLGWGSFMENQFKTMQDYKEDDIYVFGVPQFDCYFKNPNILDREEFCKKNRLDKEKRIIFFGSEGKIIPTDPDIVEIINDFIYKRALKKDCQIFVRPHFAYKDDELKFKNLLNKKNIVIDSFFNRCSVFRDSWDYSYEQISHFCNILYHSDIIINTCSTLTLDAAANKKPCILINFDGHKGRVPFFNSVSRWYVCDYYDEILKYKSATVVCSKDELLASINKLLENPNLFYKKQKEMCDHFCSDIDGKSGERLFNIIKKFSFS